MIKDGIRLKTIGVRKVRLFRHLTKRTVYEEPTTNKLFILFDNDYIEVFEHEDHYTDGKEFLR